MADKRESKGHLGKLKEIAGGRGEHVVNVIKAAFATAPFGGGIASLMDDYIPSAKVERIQRFAERVAEDLERLQHRVADETIHSDEFAYLFESCFRGVSENYQEEKLKSFRAILVNAAIDVKVSEDEKEYFLHLVSTLSNIHLRILSFMNNPREYIVRYGISENSIRGGFRDMFNSAIPNVDLEVIMSAFEDLYQMGLISTSKSIFTTMTSGQGLHLLGDRVTIFGKKFIEFCTIPTQ